MDPLELELIVVNLLSNAAEAARKSDHPTVMIDLQTARESLPGDVAAVVLTHRQWSGTFRSNVCSIRMYCAPNDTRGRFGAWSHDCLLYTSDAADD